jgi:hypothetical protein
MHPRSRSHRILTLVLFLLVAILSAGGCLIRTRGGPPPPGPPPPGPGPRHHCHPVCVRWEERPRCFPDGRCRPERFCAENAERCD